MKKEVFYNAYKSIGKIEKSLDEVTDIWNTIPHEIQNAIMEFHNEHGNLAHCLRWGLQAAEEVRENWSEVTQWLKTDEEQNAIQGHGILPDQLDGLMSAGRLYG